MNLNPSQSHAVNHEGSHLLIVAGPGTGKTHTSICRIVKFLKELKESQKILAVTFTNKAAHQMQERLQKISPGSFEKIFIGTFHQFCLSLLRQYSKHTNLPQDFRVGEPQEIEALVKSLWPDMTASQRSKILEEISQLKSRVSSPQEDFLTQYNQFLRANNLLDFDDLLLETLKCLQGNPGVLREIQATYPFIFIDEYQDINEVQHALLKILIGENNFLTAIGDPHQAIYGFRGSDVRFFESFVKDFKGACILTLEDNYRSTANLLKASSQIIQKSSDFKAPALVAKIYKQGRLIIHQTPTDKAEAEYVVHQIEKLVGGTSMFSRDSGRVNSGEEGQYGFGDIAVLYRLNALNRPLKEAFERSGIPYQISGENSSPVADESYQLRVDKVSLLTLHASKGLEFSVVFIVGCEENLLPLMLESLKTDPEEERRLFYVGMTRAKERLYLIHAQKRFLFGRLTHNAPSVFLKDIEEDLKEYEQASKIKRRPKEAQLTLFEN